MKQDVLDPSTSDDDPFTRVLVVQYAGDYLAAYHRLRQTGTETYYGHKYVLEQLASLQAKFGQTAILCCLSERAYRETLDSGVIVIGADAHPEKNSKDIIGLMQDFKPTHLVILGPMPKIIRWGIKSKCRIICICADSFNNGAIRRFFRYGRLTKLFNHPRIEWVANHGLNACRSLVQIGVDPEKIIAWDWPHKKQPDDLPAKTHRLSQRNSLIFVGSVNKQKGVGDVLEAIALLRRRALDVTLDVVGGGEVDRFKLMAQRLGVADCVNFVGLIPNETVLQRMRQATLVIVPSRHAYPEGLPLTIYEALCARTPIVASDHPMFSNRLVHRESALIFRAGKSDQLADRIQELLSDPALYSALSNAAQAAWLRLQIDLKWGDLIFRWLRNSEDDKSWLLAHRLMYD